MIIHPDTQLEGGRKEERNTDREKARKGGSGKKYKELDWQEYRAMILKLMHF